MYIMRLKPSYKHFLKQMNINKIFLQCMLLIMLKCKKLQKYECIKHKIFW